MPGPRLRVAEVAAVEADLSISATEGAKLLDMVLEKFETWTKSPKSKGFSEALAILIELRRRFEALAEEKTLQKLATCYYVMDDEDEVHYIQSQQQKKLDAWDADDDAKSFFLCRAAELTGFYGNTSEKDILTYLKREQPKLEKAAKYFLKSGSSNT